MAEVPRRKLEVIFQHAGEGRLVEAEALCRQALETHPDDVNVVALLGAVLLRSQRAAEAEPLLRRAIELEPTFAKPHEDLGLACLERDNPSSALENFDLALALDDGLVAAARGRVVALQRLGRHAEAETAREQYLALSPSFRQLAEAERLRVDGQFGAAEQVCQQVITQEPENTAALRLLAVIASEDQRPVVAEGLLRRIVALQPGNPSALFDLGRFLGECGRYPEAVEFIQQSVAHNADNAEAQLALADMLSIVGRTADALVAYEACLALQPEHAAALNGRGHMLRITGRRDEAEAAYRQAAKLKPEAGDAWWNLASLHGHRAPDDDVATMLRLLDDGKLAPPGEVAVHFALARAFEEREDYPAAWQHYRQGNAGKRALVSYDPVETEVFHDRLCATFSREMFADRSGAPPADKSPIFIVGMPRSGSTLVEQILASHSRVEGAGELPYVIMLSKALGSSAGTEARYPEIAGELTADELTGLGRSYLHHARPHLETDAPLFTDKMPANFSHLGLIRMMLPTARFIDVRRHPLATCVANYRQLFAQGKNQSYDLAELGEYYLQYAKVMTHWDTVLPGQVLRVHYERLVADLHGEVSRLLEHCGLPFEQACLDFHHSSRPVNTASSEQVRQPVYSSAVAFWKNYEAELGDLREILRPVLE